MLKRCETYLNLTYLPCPVLAFPTGIGHNVENIVIKKVISYIVKESS